MLDKLTVPVIVVPVPGTPVRTEVREGTNMARQKGKNLHHPLEIRNTGIFLVPQFASAVAVVSQVERSFLLLSHTAYSIYGSERETRTAHSSVHDNDDDDEIVA
jgi:hypothetical protein